MGDERFLSLLGLPSTANTKEMREAYERAMQAAAQSYNIRHAKALSAAFDELPAAVRRAMYPVSGSLTARVRPAPIENTNWRPSRAPRRLSRRYLLSTVLIVLIAVLGAGAVRYAGWHVRNVRAERGAQQASDVPVSNAAPAGRSRTSAAATPIRQAIGLPVGIMQETGWREYAPPPGALVDPQGGTQGRCMQSTGGPVSPFSRIAAGSLMVCPTGWVGVYRISG